MLVCGYIVTIHVKKCMQCIVGIQSKPQSHNKIYQNWRWRIYIWSIMFLPWHTRPWYTTYQIQNVKDLDSFNLSS